MATAFPAYHTNNPISFNAAGLKTNFLVWHLKASRWQVKVYMGDPLGLNFLFRVVHKNKNILISVIFDDILLI